MSHTKQAIELYSKKLDALLRYKQERSIMHEPIVSTNTIFNKTQEARASFV